MDGAREQYRHALDSAVTGKLTIPLISNRTGEIVRDAQQLPALLSAQLTNPVLWTESMATLASLGTTRVVACGPGKTLRRLARIAMPAAEITVIAAPIDLPLPTRCVTR
jgi:[acyl-carrier-protein] S-malonyltransferase